MPLSKKSVRRAIVLSIAASLSLLGCSSGSKPKSDSAKAEEALKAKFSDAGLIIANIVVRAYEQGRLGTREQVESDMEPFFSPPDYGYKIPKPFYSSGKLIPLTEMTDEQLHAFSGWYSSGKVYGILREEINAAITESREKKGSKKD
jgi:hypothetical protein